MGFSLCAGTLGVGTSFALSNPSSSTTASRYFGLLSMVVTPLKLLAETFQVIILRTVVMNAAKSSSNFSTCGAGPKPCTSSMRTSITTCRSAHQKNCDALTHLANTCEVINPSLISSCPQTTQILFWWFCYTTSSSSGA